MSGHDWLDERAADRAAEAFLNLDTAEREAVMTAVVLQGSTRGAAASRQEHDDPDEDREPYIGMSRGRRNAGWSM